ncbi:MAG: ATP-binding protein [Candidatus Zixiibacteriota bacterium]|jgi:PAS domain S-box-containing protein
MKLKSNGFRHEIQLGLALIILVLVVLNIASHYALYRAKESLADRNLDVLSEAAIQVANLLNESGGAPLSPQNEEEVIDDYDLKAVQVLPLYYETVLEIQRGEFTDTNFIRLGREINAGQMAPLLKNHPVTLHTSGNPETLFLFPAESMGSKYIIAISREDALLASLESAGKVLVLYGVLAVAAILFISVKFVHLIIRPFDRLREEAAKSGRLESSEGDEVAGLVRSYEKIISEMRANEQELVRLNDIIQKRAADLEIYNNHILHSIPSGIITLDIKCRIITANRSAGQLLNVSETELIGTDYRTGLAFSQGLREALERFQQGEKVNQETAIITTSEGNSRTVQVSISRLKDTAGEDIGAAVIFNDQTEFLKIRDELEINRRMALLGEMSGGLAHQLKNSAAAMVGLARLIIRKGGSDESLRENSQMLLKEAMETAELVSRFLDFSRPMQLQIKEFNISDVVEELVRGLREKYPEILMEVNSNTAGEAVIRGDELLLKQALLNLADNGCKAATVSGGKVEIDICDQAGALLLIVRDNGPGIPEDLKDKIFTPFISGTPSGTGLGLPLAMKIVSIHGGGISFESHPHRGTEFHIRLPRRTTGNPVKPHERAALPV